MIKIKFLIISLLMIVLSSCGTTTYSIMSDGENLSSLTQITKGENIALFPFGGDNEKNLFYIVTKDWSDLNIWKKDNVLSEAAQQLTNSTKFLSRYPAYCPESEKVYFVRQSSSSGDGDIYSVPATGGNAMTQVVVGSGYQTSPYPSPDGKNLVYIQDGEIWCKNMQTGENTLLGAGYMPVISPDGKKILFSKQEGGIDALYIMSINGTNVQKITNDSFKSIGFAKFSPDGNRIVFNAISKDKKDDDIFIMNVDGGNIIQMTINQSVDAHPYWSSDGYIYFHSDRGSQAGKYQIWRFKVNNY